MTDEEKKAIERFKNFIYTYQDVIEDEYSDYEEKESAKEYQEVSEKILNLIEKQSKEIEHQKEKRENQKKELAILNAKQIEELKEKNKFLNWYFENQKDNFVHKDKIKAKIEEVSNGTYDAKIILQSLLEKE